jgi:predicted CXXCH cytochrome family protein
MKKVLVLAAAMALLATPALAAIQGTVHDLSTLGSGTPATGTDEVCVFCHTPHGGVTGLTAPLWNRTTVNATGVYTSASLTATAAAVDVTAVNATDAPLCLSCHDGASIGGNLVNPPNNGTMDYTVLAGLVAADGDTDLLDGAASLTNDHPIGFNYAAALAQDTELNAVATVQGVLGTDVFAFGAVTGDMWCSSCHDVHGKLNGATNFPQFLRASNAGSAVCLACHNK